MRSFLFGAALAMAVGANAYTVAGKVSGEDGKAVSAAAVELLKNGIKAKTDADGNFTLHEDEEIVAIRMQSVPGYISVNNGVLSYAQSMGAPVQVQIFDMKGNRVMSQSLMGSGTVDLQNFVKAKGTYMASIKVGSVQQNVKFTTNSSFSFGNPSTNRALYKVSDTDELRVVANGFDTLTVQLNNLDTTLALTLKKSVPSEPQFSFGYALKNAPTPSKGCGKNSTLREAGSNSNAKKYNMTSAGLNREFWITLPKNYDNKKPYKILFANHCMGSNAEDFTNHTPDADHPSPYYGQQNLDKEGNYIFVAPRGDTDNKNPWRVGDNKDHIFFGELLTLMEDNYCIDTSRVFVTGFSFGSMYSNSLAQVFQHRVRAVVTYAVADWNIYIPQNAGKPIAWMDVHGTDDNLCSYNRLNSSITRILKNNGPGGTDVSSEVNTMTKHSGQSGQPHVCYDFKKVDPRFPVRVCTWKGGHQWTANDNGNWAQSWVPEDVRKFIEQF